MRGQEACEAEWNLVCACHNPSARILTRTLTASSAIMFDGMASVVRVGLKYVPSEWAPYPTTEI